MRKQGKATTREDLKEWPNTKLTNEILKQIRIDCGGQKSLEYLRKRITESFKLSEDQSDVVAKFAYDFACKQLKGSRKRIKSKLSEIESRFKYKE